MEIEEFILDNYTVPELAPNDYLVANISACDIDGILMEDPYYILLDNADNTFYIKDSSLLVNDYSKLTKFLTNTKTISLTVSGSNFIDDIMLDITDKICSENSSDTTNTTSCCNTSATGITECDGSYGLFDPLSSCYDGENAVYQSLLEETYNAAPIAAVFYVVAFDTSHDPVNGENPTRKIMRKFNFNGWTDNLPGLDVSFSTGFGGMRYMEKFRLNISKTHFRKQSKKAPDDGESIYPEYIPRGGEYIMLKYDKTYYEITLVEQEYGNLLRSNSYVFQLKRYEDDHARFDSSTSATMVNDIASVVDIDDIFNIADFVDDIKDEVLYEPEDDEEEENDPFAGWN